ncbi:hypothetical protein AAC387_Pa01g2834 [Persea americana]
MAYQGLGCSQPVDLPKHPSGNGIVPTIQNVVSTVNLDCKVDLKAVALHARNAEYNPRRFAAVIMRIREPKTTALIFASGKMYNAEIFPGLMYRMKQPKIVLLVFQSGKIVLTGAKLRDEIYTAFQNIYPVLAEFRIPRYEGEQ